MQALIRRLSVAATAGMFVVLLMGATVTSTGSAEGCGRSWPLCHGQFIPEFAVATLIEYGHRAVTGGEGLLIAALSAGTWAYWRQHRTARVLVLLMVGFLLLQSAMGAWAVLYPQTPAVLALHFGISLVAFASVFLTMSFLRWTQRGAWRPNPPPAGLKVLIWASTAYVLLVVYLGAYLRHVGAVLACPDWPLCHGAIWPDLSGPVGIAFAHRLAALGSTVLLAWLAVWTHRLRMSRPDLAQAGAIAFLLVLLQSLSGGLVVLTQLNLFSTLSHAGIMALLFASLSYLSLHVLPSSVWSPDTPAAPRLQWEPAPAIDHSRVGLRNRSQ